MFSPGSRNPSAFLDHSSIHSTKGDGPRRQHLVLFPDEASAPPQSNNQVLCCPPQLPPTDSSISYSSPTPHGFNRHFYQRQFVAAQQLESYHQTPLVVLPTPSYPDTSALGYPLSYSLPQSGSSCFNFDYFQSQEQQHALSPLSSLSSQSCPPSPSLLLSSFSSALHENQMDEEKVIIVSETPSSESEGVPSGPRAYIRDADQGERQKYRCSATPAGAAPYSPSSSSLSEHSSRVLPSNGASTFQEVMDCDLTFLTSNNGEDKGNESSNDVPSVATPLVKQDGPDHLARVRSSRTLSPIDLEAPMSRSVPASSIASNIAKTSPTLAPIPKRREYKKMHQCHICQKMFPRPSGLRTHMNTHDHVRPYKCLVQGCDKSFTVKSNCKRHMRIHGITLEESTRRFEEYAAVVATAASAAAVSGSSDQNIGSSPCHASPTRSRGIPIATSLRLEQHQQRRRRQEQLPYPPPYQYHQYGNHTEAHGTLDHGYSCLYSTPPQPQPPHTLPRLHPSSLPSMRSDTPFDPEPQTNVHIAQAYRQPIFPNNNYHHPPHLHRQPHEYQPGALQQQQQQQQPPSWYPQPQMLPSPSPSSSSSSSSSLSAQQTPIYSFPSNDHHWAGATAGCTVGPFGVPSSSSFPMAAQPNDGGEGVDPSNHGCGSISTNTVSNSGGYNNWEETNCDPSSRSHPSPSCSSSPVPSPYGADLHLSRSGSMVHIQASPLLQQHQQQPFSQSLSYHPE